MYTCLTVQVENLHAMGHFKMQFPTLLQYAQNPANTVYESMKRVVQWAAYYYTPEKSYDSVVSQGTPLDALARMTHLKPGRKLNDREREVMLEWAANNGKAVRQRTVRQETIKFKAGTLPLNMYALFAQSTEKIIIEHVKDDHHEESEHDEEQESEYETEFESELPPTVDSDQVDEMTFLVADELFG